jgi:hypothetical protein
MRYVKLILILSFLTSAGCASMSGSSSNDVGGPPAQSSFFYDFKDIQVPEEMKIETDKSSVSPVDGGKAGVIRFKGRAEPISLFDFFFNTMPKDGWTLLSFQKYQRYLLVFTKDNRVCVITVEEAPIYYTLLEVWVSPRVQSGFAPAYSTGTQPVDTYPATGGSLQQERTLSQ